MKVRKSLTSFVKNVIENDCVDNHSRPQSHLADGLWGQEWLTTGGGGGGRGDLVNESVIEHTAHQFCAAESAPLVLPSLTTKRRSSFKAEKNSLFAVCFSSK